MEQRRLHHLAKGNRQRRGRSLQAPGGPSWEITECGSATVARAKLVRSVKLRHRPTRASLDPAGAACYRSFWIAQVASCPSRGGRRYVCVRLEGCGLDG